MTTYVPTDRKISSGPKLSDKASKPNNRQGKAGIRGEKDQQSF